MSQEAVEVRTVAILGASGHLGPTVLQELSRSFPSIRVLVRASSTSSIPSLPNTETIKLSDAFPVDELTSALQGVDALVSTLPASTVPVHENLIAACLAAGVRRFVPTDYGSVPADNADAQRLVPLYKAKTDIRAACAAAAERSGGVFSWSAVVCGHFFDYGLATGLLGFDLKERRARLFDGGNVRFSASTLEQIARAVVAELRSLDVSAGRVCRVQSFCTTQRDVLKLLESISGETWTVEEVESMAYVEKEAAKMNAGDHEARENVVCVLGILKSEWNKGNEMVALGMAEEDLKTVIEKVWASR